MYWAHAAAIDRRTIWAGKVPIGSEHPIACQTMGTTDTRDVMATVEQAMRVADYGGDLFRITVQVRPLINLPHVLLSVQGGQEGGGGVHSCPSHRRLSSAREQGKKEAEACHSIREELFKRGYDIPLVADIHFQPKVRGRCCRGGEARRVDSGTLAARSQQSKRAGRAGRERRQPRPMRIHPSSSSFPPIQFVCCHARWPC